MNKKTKKNIIAEICDTLKDSKKNKKAKILKEAKNISKSDKTSKTVKIDFGTSIKKNKRAILKQCKEYAKLIAKVTDPEKIAKKLIALGFDVDLSSASIGITINVPIKLGAKKTIDKPVVVETPTIEDAPKKKRGRPKKVAPVIEDPSSDEIPEEDILKQDEVEDKPEVELVPVGDTFTDEVRNEVNEDEVSDEELLGEDDEQPNENENDEYDEIDRDPDADFFESRAEAFSRMNDDGEFED